MVYTEQEKLQFLNDLLDSRKVALVCEKHNYAGGGFLPYPNCAGCWQVFYVELLGKTPPHLREQRLEELEALVHHMVESVEHGEFDVNLFSRPKIKISRA